tara:strand:+ start:3414 stop:4553 length:1140 start_codon:yes stop_codon:yes gene_type:complete
MAIKSKIDWVVGWIGETELKKSSDINRYRENNELIYCLRSIKKYASWINKIHIIIGGSSETPSWLDANHDKINIVKESSLYKPIQKNSETKKLFYHLIPGIADYFFTSDDDMFLVNNINLKKYFKNGRIILNSVGWCCESEKNNDKTYISMLWNDSKKGTNDGKGHIPLLWNKSQYKLEVDKLNKHLYLNMGEKRFNPWIDMKKSMVKTKTVINGLITRPLLWINNTNIKYIKENYFTLIYKKLFFLLNQQNFICINDDFNTNNNSIYKNEYILTQQFLMFLFPERCSWEKSRPILKFSVGNSLIKIPIKIGAIKDKVFKRLLNYHLPTNMKCFITPEKEGMNDLLLYEYKNDNIIITKKNENELSPKHTIILEFVMID